MGDERLTVLVSSNVFKHNEEMQCYVHYSAAKPCTLEAKMPQQVSSSSGESHCIYHFDFEAASPPIASHDRKWPQR